MEYKLYFQDDAGRVRARFDLQADDDDQAEVISRGAADGREMELWCGARRVKIFREAASAYMAPRSRRRKSAFSLKTGAESGEP